MRLMRTFLLSTLLLLSGCMEVGRHLYNVTTDVERRVFGLDEKQAVIGDLEINYYEGGPADGPVVVLLHGFTADRNNWPRFSRALTEEYRVIAPDLAGHGKSTYRKDWSYSAPAQAERLHRFVRALGIKKFHLGGNSMGGFISAHYALAYPGDLLSLFLTDAAGVASPKPSPMFRMIDAGKNPFFFNDPKQMRDFFALAMEDPPFAPGFVVDAVGQMNYVERRARLEQIFADFHNKNNIDGSLGEIRMPTLILWGKQDRILDVSMGEVYKAGIPHARYVVMDGVGHLPMVERPSESSQLYLEFLQSLKATAN